MTDNVARCPRDETPLQHNEAGAWCPNYPCRFSISRAKTLVAVKIARKLWGPIR